MVADDAVADAQAETRALADFAGREERIEDPAQVLVIDAVAGVAHEELDGRRPDVETRADGERVASRGRASPAPHSG